MKCEVCGKNEATVQYVHISENEKKVVFMCRRCEAALKAGKAGTPSSSVTAGTAKTKVQKELGELKQSQGELLRCDACQTTYEQFRKRGRFGCSHCYEAFGAEIERLLKRIHGAVRHTGKAVGRKAHPEEGGEKIGLEALRRRLQEAVAAEAYEEAAKLRDLIDEVENGPHGRG